MKKRLFVVLASLVVLFAAGYFIMLFMFNYEPTPDQGDVEEMVSERGLEEFGDVEGSYLLTPRNYGYFNDQSIYIVEQYLDKDHEYADQYVVIEKGEELAGEDDQAISQIQAKEGFQDEIIDDFQVLSKHRITVYKDDERIVEDWLFKITYQYDGQYFLTFMDTEENRFNFFTKGYEQFLGF